MTQEKEKAIPQCKG